MTSLTDTTHAMNELLKLVQQENIQFQQNCGMAQFTSYGTGGPALLMAMPENLSQLISLIKLAKTLPIPCFTLGGGSNLLISDRGFDGLIIKLGQHEDFGVLETTLDHFPGYTSSAGSPATLPASSTSHHVATRHPAHEIATDAEALPQHNKGPLMMLGAAAPMGRLISMGIREGLKGVIGLAGIPGTIGGAVAGNAGTSLGAIGDGVAGIEVCIPGDERPRQLMLHHGELSFGYRSSFIPPSAIITRVYWQSEQISPSLVQEEISTLLARRRASQPSGCRTAGSVFKNPPGSPAAGFLLEKAGMKGKVRGQSAFSTLHANFIITAPGAYSGEVKALMDEAMDRVYSLFSVKLEPETRLLGF